MPAFLDQVANTIQRHHMLSGGETVLVGLSGGADSTALLHVLAALRKSYQLALYAAHINHMLRGEEADRDEAFVRSMCARLQIPCFCTHLDVAAIAQEKHCSVEAAGHHARYTYFQEIAAQVGADRIAVAHNQNDVAETLLLHLTRGCALSGLCGIPPVNGAVIRPLIQTSRQEIEEYLAQNELSYVTDSTNLTNDYPRNFIRHAILPELERLNPSVCSTLAANAARFAIDNVFIDQQTEALCKTCLHMQKHAALIDITQLHQAHPALQRRVVLRAVSTLAGSTRQITQHHLDAILSLCATGKQFQMRNLFVRRTSNALVFTRQKPTPQSYCYPLELDKPCTIPELGIAVMCTVCHQITDKNAMYLDGNQLAGMQLLVRSRLNGDRFRTKGGGEKKLKDFFIDQKIPIDTRQQFPLLIADGKIAAILHMQVSKDFAPNTQTTLYYKITITGGNTDVTYGL